MSASDTSATAWFARRTWRAAELDRDALAARRAEQGTSVSVVIPARNESATVGGVVAACRALVPDLVDEVVVLDGASEDDTTARAEAAGARVVADGAVLAEHGRPQGKGDALWRSLAVTEGDVVCFVDADIHNPDPRFVVGLLGPLLADPDIQLVKAFYERPLQVGDERQTSGGGRVTELCARPLLNLFWPELAGLVQPLAGEYAGRRSLLEAIPFVTGYGVELGMLVDTLHHAGAEAIAQVDVEERIHHNQPLEALGRMAGGILQTAARRLAAEGRLHADALPTQLLQFSRDAEGTHPVGHDVGVLERPPMATLR